MADPVNLQTDVVRQHTVPRFLLKHFSTLGKGKRQRLYAFDKAAGRAYATTPDDATVRNTFYNLDNHPDRLSLEPLLGIYEHHAAPVIAAPAGAQGYSQADRWRPLQAGRVCCRAARTNLRRTGAYLRHDFGAHR